jgi:hypothetical protein
VGSIRTTISTISMADSHVLPSLQAQAASTLEAANGGKMRTIPPISVRRSKNPCGKK